MHGTEHRVRERRALRLSAPQPPVSPAAGSTLPGAPQLSPSRDRLLVAAFRSPATATPFGGSIPGSKLPTCYFASSPAGFPARSALLLGYPYRFAPAGAASMLLARCSSADWLDRLRHQSPLPFRALTPVRIKAFNWLCRRSARLPAPPDLLSLPAAASIARFRLRIIVPGPLRFRRLAVPQTSWNLSQYAPKCVFRQSICEQNGTFSSTFISFVSKRLQNGSGAHPVDKTARRVPVLAILEPSCEGC